jgi:cytochrome c peroxidase
VNGVDSEDPSFDQGVGLISHRQKDVGRFKASSLRNIEVTFPYMHDGRFQTIDQVIEHYNWSVKPHPNLDPRLQDFSANGMALPEVEKVALAAFLRTLTDHQFLTDPKFSDPFDHDGQ